MAPVEVFIVSPVGRLPEVIENVKGPVPPEVAIEET
jgi:hypothetical protein